MQLHFTGRNLELTPALKTFATEKFQRVARRDASITNVNIVFQVDNLTHNAEATLHLSGTEIHASAQAEDMYSAIDALVDKILGQITKIKEKAGHR
ncbi:MAG: ribosome hibernation-promoting factor, HPF/YfiA family [Gammaproteobacteria bacterium]